MITWSADWVASDGARMFFVGGRIRTSGRIAASRSTSIVLELTGPRGVAPAPYAASYRLVAVSDPKALQLSELEALVKRSHELVAGRLPKKLRTSLGIQAC